jgi:hypothetical protein
MHLRFLKFATSNHYARRLHLHHNKEKPPTFAKGFVAHRIKILNFFEGPETIAKF